jgi:hypothetical protein
MLQVGQQPVLHQQLIFSDRCSGELPIAENLGKLLMASRGVVLPELDGPAIDAGDGLASSFVKLVLRWRFWARHGASLFCVQCTHSKENRTRRADRQVTLTSVSVITYNSGGYRARTGDLLAARTVFETL